MLKKIGKILLDLIEIYIPVAAFLVLFIAFLWGVICRYVFNAPQSWTYEVSSICFLWVTILAGCIVQRYDEHISFDMLYLKATPKTRCLMRVVSNLLTAVVVALAVPASILYLLDMGSLTTQIIKLPRWLVFAPFTVLFVVTVVRAFYRAVLDIRAFRAGSYIQSYACEDDGKGEKA